MTGVQRSRVIALMRRAASKPSMTGIDDVEENQVGRFRIETGYRLLAVLGQDDIVPQLLRNT